MQRLRPKSLLRIAGTMLALAVFHQEALADAQKPVDPSELQRAVEACFAPPMGATGPVVISATFLSDGSLDQRPAVIEKGEGALNEAFATAGIRAILRCQPQLAAMGIKGEVRFRFAPPPSDAMDDPASVPSSERLEDMRNAAQSLKDFAARNGRSQAAMRPTKPEISTMLDILCRPKEAEKLVELSAEDYRALSSYTRSVSVVMDVYDTISAGGTQKDINVNMRELGACLDAALWSTRAVLANMHKIFSATPALSNDPEATAIRVRTYSNVTTVIEGGLEAIGLDGMEPRWCDARLAPLTSLIEVASPVISDKDRQTLRLAMHKAEKCSDKTRASLQALLQPREP